VGCFHSFSRTTPSFVFLSRLRAGWSERFSVDNPVDSFHPRLSF